MLTDKELETLQNHLRRKDDMAMTDNDEVVHLQAQYDPSPPITDWIVQGRHARTLGKIVKPTGPDEDGWVFVPTPGIRLAPGVLRTIANNLENVRRTERCG